MPTIRVLVGSALCILMFCGCATTKSKATDLIVAGVYNPKVTQANIATTICKPGWTATVRPPVYYTSTLKRIQMRGLGLTGNPLDYEEDHFIPLELGGHPTNPNNLWPQIFAVTDPCSAHVKDVDENAFNKKVCSGAMTLDAARAAIAAKWIHCKRP
jgi:hypothetical protein